MSDHLVLEFVPGPFRRNLVSILGAMDAQWIVHSTYYPRNISQCKPIRGKGKLSELLMKPGFRLRLPFMAKRNGEVDLGVMDAGIRG